MLANYRETNFSKTFIYKRSQINAKQHYKRYFTKNCFYLTLMRIKKQLLRFNKCIDRDVKIKKIQNKTIRLNWLKVKSNFILKKLIRNRP